jgi:NADH-quinone oxidoreductase subunit J
VSEVAYWAVALVTLGGAVTVIRARETMRLIVGLGAFLLGVAGLYLYHGLALLAASQVFLYVGGVLVLFVFAIMALRRGEGGRTELAPRFDLGAASVCGGLFVLIVFALAPLTPFAGNGSHGLEDTAALLMGEYLPQFEIVGVLLLVALVAALALTGRGEDR